jgi:hypothetical protein
MSHFLRKGSFAARVLPRVFSRPHLQYVPGAPWGLPADSGRALTECLLGVGGPTVSWTCWSDLTLVTFRSFPFPPPSPSHSPFLSRSFSLYLSLSSPRPSAQDSGCACTDCLCEFFFNPICNMFRMPPRAVLARRFRTCVGRMLFGKRWSYC